MNLKSFWVSFKNPTKQMKNIFLIPTNKSSRLCKDGYGTYHVTESMISQVPFFKNQHIYITLNIEIKSGDWQLSNDKHITKRTDNFHESDRKIILTTDPDLIKDGVQAIDDEFLEWFVKNSSCEFVETERLENGQYVDRLPDGSVIEGVYENYKIIIPPEKPKQEYNNLNYGGGFTEEDIQRVSTKQETIEEAAKNYAEHQLKGISDKILKYQCENDFISGAKYQSERMYSEEEVWGVINIAIGLKDLGKTHVEISQYFEQIKKKN